MSQTHVDSNNSANLSVLDYRMSQVEAAVKGLGNQFDTFINGYPNNEMIRLTLSPILEDIRELKKKNARVDEDKARYQQQMRLAMWTAFIGPVVVGIIIALLTGVIKP